MKRLTPCHQIGPSTSISSRRSWAPGPGRLFCTEGKGGMPKILIIHGAGMNMRGKVQTEIFGLMTLPEYDERIRGYAAELGLDIEIFHSNIEGEVVNKIYAPNDTRFYAPLSNPP